MNAWKEKEWQHVVTGVDGKCQIFGVNIFDCEWHATGKKAAVHDPLYGQGYSFPIYRVAVNGDNYEFAAGEFSNCVWGFFVARGNLKQARSKR